MKGLLLINLGSPDSTSISDVKKYLDEFLMDKRVIGKSYLFTVTAKGKEWAEAVQKAITANPGGIMSIVQNSTSVKISSIVIA